MMRTELSNNRLSDKFWPKDRLPRLRHRLAIYYYSLLNPFWKSRFTLRRYYSLLLASLWRYYSRLRFGKTRWITVYDSRQLKVRTDDFRSYRIAELGGSQKEKIAIWSRLSQLDPAVCIDVGANYGEFSAVLAGSGRRVIAIEANPLTASCLRDSFAEHDNVTVVHAAAMESDGEVSFFYNPRSSGSASLSEYGPKNDKIINLRAGRVHEARIPARRLDTLVPELTGAMPESIILKADVEAFEVSVMTGASQLLGGAVWWRALLEFSARAISEAGGDAIQAWEALRKYPGFIIGGANDMEDAVHLNTALPPTMPGLDVDIIIGQGAARRSAPLEGKASLRTSNGQQMQQAARPENASIRTREI
jgi:FkbM family methyltransferase